MSPARQLSHVGVREVEEVYYRSRGWVPQSEKADLERQLAEAQQQRDAFWESRDAAEQRAEQAEAELRELKHRLGVK